MIPCVDENCEMMDSNHTHPHLSIPDNTYDQALEDVARAVVRTCMERHHAYGHNLLRHGELGILMRIDDKTERLKHMLDNDVWDVAEPHTDSWIDIAGYAIQAILMRTGSFTLPMREERRAQP